MNKKQKQPPLREQFEEIADEYASLRKKVDVFIPSNLRILCNLFEIPVAQLINDFMRILAQDAIKASEEQQTLATEYFISCQYGSACYSETEVRQMFDELKARHTVRINGHNETKEAYYKLHMQWSNMYAQHFYEKWLTKARRRAESSAFNNH